MKNLKYLPLVIAITVLYSCNQEEDLVRDWIDDNPRGMEATDSGQVSLQNLVVLGTSLASGVQDGALYNDGQANSFPALLAKQFELVGGNTDFGQPNISSENGYHLIFNPTGKTDSIIGRSLLDLSDQAPVAEPNGELITAFGGDKTKIRNFSAPLVYAGQLVTALAGGPADVMNTAFSPLYQRFATNPGTSTMVGDALAANPTFFVYEGGMNDVLLYALRGGNGTAPISSVQQFTQAVSAGIGVLASRNTFTEYTVPGVVLNIPDILKLPFFTLVPYNAIPMPDSTTAANTGLAFADYNAGLAAAVQFGAIDAAERDKRTISFSIGANAVVINDKDLTTVNILQNQFVFMQLIWPMKLMLKQFLH